MDNETIEKWMAGGTIYPRDIAPHADPSVTCGSCGTYPEGWVGDSWKCRRNNGECVSRQSHACELWRERPEPEPVDWEAMQRISELFLKNMPKEYLFPPPPPVRERVIRDHLRLQLALPARHQKFGNLRDGSESVVYFVDCGSFTKIGHTAQRIIDRMNGIKTHNPFPLALWGLIAGPVSLEREIHEVLASHRRRNEWFEFDEPTKGDIRRWIAENGGNVFPAGDIDG